MREYRSDLDAARERIRHLEEELARTRTPVRPASAATSWAVGAVAMLAAATAAVCLGSAWVEYDKVRPESVAKPPPPDDEGR
jgi:hypothetical protein